MILAGFAGIVGVLTTSQVRDQFQTQVATEAQRLQHELEQRGLPTTGKDGAPDCGLLTGAAGQIRIYDLRHQKLICTQDSDLLARGKPKVEPVTNVSDIDRPIFPTPKQSPESLNVMGYRVDVRTIATAPPGRFALLYARPFADIDRTEAKIRIFLLLGVFAGSILALLAGLATANRAMRPIKALSDAAREIERTRDPSRHVPHPQAEDEVAELARTLEGMLGALNASRVEIEATLDRQRQFVADASHELRTPLTSVLANLELLADELSGEQAESAKSALRSTRRMRRLVGDLLLLARADAGREPRALPTDLRDVLIDAAAELGPIADRHDLVLDAGSAQVNGVRDDLHRMALNLLENAVRHTPPGTQIRAATAVDGRTATLLVEDDGPGIPADLGTRVFERFVRGGGDGGRGSGLGLAIVRAVVDSHGGHVELTAPRTHDGRPGTRFLITIPLLGPADVAGEPSPPGQTSTTTGSTIGRRRSLS